MKHTIDVWRKVAKEEYGIELYLIRVENEPDFGPKYLDCGFDSAIDFQPLLMGEFNAWWKNLPFRIMNHLFKGKYQWFNKHFSYASYVKYRIKNHWRIINVFRVFHRVGIILLDVKNLPIWLL